MNKVEFLKYDFTGKNIVIIGKPSSGKTHISGILKSKLPGHLLIHTDDYMKHPEPSAISAIISLASRSQPHIIEGVLGYQVLLTGVSQQTYSPDIIICVDISFNTLTDNYRRSAKNIQSIKGFCFRHKRIFDEYLFLLGSRKPLIIKIKNDNRIF